MFKQSKESFPKNI